MLDRYTLELRSAEADRPRLSVIIEISSEGSRISQLEVFPSLSESPPLLPKELGEINLQLCVAMANSLLKSLGCPNSKPDVELVAVKEESIEQKSETEGSEVPLRVPQRPAKYVPKTNYSDGADVPLDLTRVYWRLGSVAKVAKHYDVPRRVAQGWVNDLQTGRPPVRRK
ncbi:hypothetical protein [Mycobacteroides abscessus]|uniref:hypothetical protein n=1 Tax=Mycobacteroides abscessus TaxID=36809 RepID=UPI00104646AC|nr:hypothetical protein [Mycobacteroides abscessus]MDO3110500.1 hypothetical protein [Mycobacteroides abscessus subsp. abscessus]